LASVSTREPGYLSEYGSDRQSENRLHMYLNENNLGTLAPKARTEKPSGDSIGSRTVTENEKSPLVSGSD